MDPRRDAATAVRELANAARVPQERAAGGGLAVAAPPGLRESRLKILQVHLRQGTITQEGYEQHLLEMGLDDDQGFDDEPLSDR